MPPVPLTISKRFSDDVNGYKDSAKIWDEVAHAYEQIFFKGDGALDKKRAENLYSTRINQQKRLVFLRTDAHEYIPVCYATDHDKYEQFLDNVPPRTKADLRLQDTTLDVHYKLAQAVDTLNNFDFKNIGKISPPTAQETAAHEEQASLTPLLKDEETFGFIADSEGKTAYFFNMNHPSVIRVDENGISAVKPDTPANNTQTFNDAADSDDALERAITHFEKLQAQSAKNADGLSPQVAEGGLDATVSLYNSTHTEPSPLTAFASKSVQDSTTGYLKQRFNTKATEGAGIYNDMTTANKAAPNISTHNAL